MSTTTALELLARVDGHGFGAVRHFGISGWFNPPAFSRTYFMATASILVATAVPAQVHPDGLRRHVAPR